MTYADTVEQIISALGQPTYERYGVLHYWGAAWEAGRSIVDLNDKCNGARDCMCGNAGIYANIRGHTYSKSTERLETVIEELLEHIELFSMDFKMSFKEFNACHKFMDEHTLLCPDVPTAIGGRWSYRFTPTSIGCAIVIQCCCGTKIDVTDYGSW